MLAAPHSRVRPPHTSSARRNPVTCNFVETHDYSFVRLAGSGAFGAVFEVTDPFGNHYAVKKVVQDPRYKNRELDVLRRLNHPNCLHLHRSFFTREGDPERVYLHIVTDLLPTDLSAFAATGWRPSPAVVSVFAFQLFRGLAYLHSLGICHRDIKPTNVLIDAQTCHLEICDFGSAKPMLGFDESVSYIATRNYRAPELLFDCTNYTFPIDVWAAGCVIAELSNHGKRLFSGDSNDSLIASISKVIGPPSETDLEEYQTQKGFVKKKQKKGGLAASFPPEAPAELVDLLQRVFVYSPTERISAEECVEHPYFNAVRSGTVRLPNGTCFAPEEGMEKR
jgi:glycogen synthase kinase 3 beta